MRHPPEADRIGGGGWSVSEIHDAFEHELTRVRRKVKVTDETLARAHLLNAMVLYVLTKPIAERNRIIEDGAQRYARHLESDVELAVFPVEDVVNDGPRVPRAASPSILDNPQSGKPKRPNARTKKRD